MAQPLLPYSPSSPITTLNSAYGATLSPSLAISTRTLRSKPGDRQSEEPGTTFHHSSLLGRVRCWWGERTSVQPTCCPVHLRSSGLSLPFRALACGASSTRTNFGEVRGAGKESLQQPLLLLLLPHGEFRPAPHSCHRRVFRRIYFPVNTCVDNIILSNHTGGGSRSVSYSSLIILALLISSHNRLTTTSCCFLLQSLRNEKVPRRLFSQRPFAAVLRKRSGFTTPRGRNPRWATSSP